MYSLFNALHEGRLIELPDNQKDHALQLLAHLIEAVPDLPAGTDVAGAVLIRERGGNTGIGKGWGCPHARIPGEGEMLCAVGWSPNGIDYGSSDGLPVRMVLMYLIPENQKNTYLKEISSLAKALNNNPAFQSLGTAADLNEVRLRLLDLIGATLEAAGPDARARMIRIEARQAAAVPPTGQTASWLAGATVLPLTVLTIPGAKPVVLAQNRELISLLESLPGLADALSRQEQVSAGSYRVLGRSFVNFQPDRVLYDCLAIKTSEPAANGLSPGKPG